MLIIANNFICGRESFFVNGNENGVWWYSFSYSVPIVVNASESTDPDVHPWEDSGLLYEWYCRRKVGDGEQLDLSTDDAAKQIANVNYPNEKLVEKLQDKDFKGCFGNGAGRLKEKGVFDYSYLSFFIIWLNMLDVFYTSDRYPLNIRII